MTCLECDVSVFVTCTLLDYWVFFFKQKTAYEMRISDWSSDVCSSDLSFWHWALGADGGHGHAQPPFRSSRLIGAERQPTSDCRQSLQQSRCWQARSSRSCDELLYSVGSAVRRMRTWCG